jgi:hypothetical protein
MSSARATVLLLCAFTIVGCHKKPLAAADAGAAPDNGDAGASSEAGAAEAGAASDDGGGEAGAAADGGDDGGDDGGGATDNGDDGGGAEGGSTTVVRGAGFAGSFNCFGVLNLHQTGTTVAGDGSSRAGNKVHSVDITCNARGDKCTGIINHFTSNNGAPPKPAGKGKISFRAVNGGLEYTETSGSGFCARR